MEAYQDPQPGCYGEPHDTACCVLGWYVDFFFDLGECVNGNELCHFSGYSAQKLVHMAGPFVSMEECIEMGPD